MREPTTMGRPREFDENEALAAIMDVFWTKGFGGASLSDLVSATATVPPYSTRSPDGYASVGF